VELFRNRKPGSGFLFLSLFLSKPSPGFVPLSTFFVTEVGKRSSPVFIFFSPPLFTKEPFLGRSLRNNLSLRRFLCFSLPPFLGKGFPSNPMHITTLGRYVIGRRFYPPSFLFFPGWCYFFRYHPFLGRGSPFFWENVWHFQRLVFWGGG